MLLDRKLNKMRRSVLAALHQIKPVSGMFEQVLPQFSPAFTSLLPRQLHVGWSSFDAAGKGPAPASKDLHETLQKEGSPNLSSVNHPDGAFNVHDGQPGVTYAMPSYPPTEESAKGTEVSPSDNIDKQSSGSSKSSSKGSSSAKGGEDNSSKGGSGEKGAQKPAKETDGGGDSSEGNSSGGGSRGKSSEGLSYIDEQTSKPNLSYATQGSGGKFAQANAPPPDAEVVQEGHAPRMGTPAPAHRPAKYVSSEGEKVAPQEVKTEDYSAAEDKSKKTQDVPDLTSSS